MAKKSSKNVKGATGPVAERKMEKKSDGEEYALVTKVLGSGRFMVKINLRPSEVIGRICGKMRYKKAKHSNRVEVGSVVLVGIRDYQENAVDIVHVFEPSEVKSLIKTGLYIQETDRVVPLLEDEPEAGFDFSDI